MSSNLSADQLADQLEKLVNAIETVDSGSLSSRDATVRCPLRVYVLHSDLYEQNPRDLGVPPNTPIGGRSRRPTTVAAPESKN